MTPAVVRRMMDATPGLPTLDSGLIEKCPTQPSVEEQQTLQEGRSSERERRKTRRRKTRRRRKRGRDPKMDNKKNYIIRTLFPFCFDTYMLYNIY